MRIIFLGTPAFAVPTLERLLAWNKGQVVAVVTQPDRPVGRQQKLKAPPVKLVASSTAIPVLQPEKLSKSPETIEQLQSLKPDVLVLVAYGQLLKTPVLKLAPLGVVNLHASLLPKYRGAAPINWALINGETTTGITTMLLNEGMDTGPILLKKEISITINDTAADLALTMSHLGGDLMIETLEGLSNGTIVPQPQDDSQATLAPPLTPLAGKIDWTQGPLKVHNLVRSLIPWPGAYSHFEDTRVKILATAIPEKDLILTGSSIPSRWAAGLFFVSNNRCFVNCSSNDKRLLELLEVQPESRSRLPAASWVNGLKGKTGVALGAFHS